MIPQVKLEVNTDCVGLSVSSVAESVCEVFLRLFQSHENP